LACNWAFSARIGLIPISNLMRELCKDLKELSNNGIGY